MRLYQGGNETLERLFFDYVNETRLLQHLDTLSGDFLTGGLGDPKCGRLGDELMVDST